MSSIFQRVPRCRLSLALLCVLLLAGCAGKDPLLSVLDSHVGEETTAREADMLVAGDPAGPIPKPHIPEGLLAAAAAEKPAEPPTDQKAAIAYTVESVSRDAPEVAERFSAVNSLSRLRDVPLHTLTGLEQRLENSLKEGNDLLHSLGFYDGTVNGRIFLPPPGPQGGMSPPASAGEAPAAAATGGTGGEPSAPSAPPVRVLVTFRPGPLYHVGTSEIIRTTGPALPNGTGTDQAPAEEVAAAAVLAAAYAGAARNLAGPQTPPDAPKLPTTLADAGLPEGAPAIAQDVLNAVDRVLQDFRNRGYPHAVIASTRYVLDREKKLLESQVTVNSGHYARMGKIILRGQETVKDSYLRNLRTWRPGEPWSQDKVEEFREALRNSGLFASINLEPAETLDDQGRLDIVTTPEAGPRRTLGGALKYDTDFGVGVVGFWENRNLTGRGDNLRFDAPIWQDMQQVTAKYRLPFFLRKDQDFIAQAAGINQKTDAYDLQAGRVAAGIERRVGRNWNIAVQAILEGGSLKDPDKSRTEYFMAGLPTTVTYSTANSLLNATEGVRISVSVAPYTGEYRDSFTVARSRVDIETYLPLVGKDRLILALRGSGGLLAGGSSSHVPPSVRFYAGGGGSVRGYEYQSLGPRNSKRDPLGGGALAEISIEPRLRIGENWGLVAFLDGGNVYDMPDMEYGTDLRWGAGLGFRYYTAIGPVRFDVATPLNPRKHDESLQFYISIGQSF